MDNIITIIINFGILLIGLVLLMMSFNYYVLAVSLWLMIYPIVGQVNAIEGWEIFPAERIVTSLLFLAALFKLGENWEKLPSMSLFRYYLLFIFALFLSSAVSDMPLQSAGRSLTFLVPLMWGIIVLAAIVDNESALRMLIKAMLIGFTVTIAYGILEFILQNNYLVNWGIIRQDVDYLSVERFGIGGRITSFIGQPVYAALYFLTMLPLILFYRKYYGKTSVMKVVYAILFALGVMMIFLTGTRSVYLPLIISPLIYLWFQKGKKIFSSKILYIYLGIFVLLPFVLPETIINFTTETFQILDPLNIGATSSLYGRLELTGVFWDLFKEHVLLGFGPGFIQRMAADVAMFRNLAGMENQYAGLLVETGVIGFLTFMAFIIKAIKMGSSASRDNHPFTSDWAIITCSIFALVMVIAVSVYIVNGPIMNYLMMYLAIMLGVKARCEAAVGELEDQDRGLPISNGSENGAPLLQGE